MLKGNSTFKRMAERFEKVCRKSKHSGSKNVISSMSEDQRKSRTKCIESRTPPLPTMEDCTIDELLKKREVICENLHKISKHTRDEQKLVHKSNERKRRYVRKEKYIKTDIDSKVCKESSDSNQEYLLSSESEDEEYIIELRRKQRKQLLDQINSMKDNKFKNEDGPAASQNVHTNHESKKDHTIIKQDKQYCTKETTDMFADKDEIPEKKNSANINHNANNELLTLSDNWDDHDGYYRVSLGDRLNNNKFTIKAILGQGVFANVVRAQDHEHGHDVAIKIVRNNEYMLKTGLKEIEFLKEINRNDTDNKYHCIKLLQYFMHKGHLCLVLEPLYMDMRCLLKKFGQHKRISLKTLMNYTKQLLLALKLLMKIGIIHADIKPDNILVNENKNVIKLCDFGSATKVGDNDPTPYLVSRYYRAPEIILGIPYNHGVDIWSTACSIYEMATSTILFVGRSNNKMLKCFMDLKGRFSNKLLRKSKFKDQHFNTKNNFLLQKKDRITERDTIVEVTTVNISRDLHNDLKKYFKKITVNEEKKVAQLKDLLDKMLMLDEKQRLSVENCLKHSFIHSPI
ncbi:serine/threonine-protein kinase PRP4 homolog isoform X2 [Battus philenor]|uniref:serine/threonine-protein kinase PRP4 homolog isoform X2 n=1 Tax=Battus philenor TaxID=42288 RepID=UPI0035CEEA76